MLARLPSPNGKTAAFLTSWLVKLSMDKVYFPTIPLVTILDSQLPTLQETVNSRK